MTPPNPVLVYHITHIDNLASIVNSGAIWSHNERMRLGLEHQDIAHRHIRRRRAERIVEAGPGGDLNNYVPWYFAPRSPMLYSISKGGVGTFPGTQTQILHLVSDLKTIEDAGCEWVFTDGHAEMEHADFFTRQGDLEKIDWELMGSKWWNDTIKDPNRKFRRQAEFLAHRGVPWEAVRQIGVREDVMAKKVGLITKDVDHKPDIVVRPKWYYQ